MGQNITLTASDGAKIGAYKATPAGTPRGGVVVIQEIFGVNQHIREVADGYASDGYLAVAPALFDRVEKGIELGYEGDDMQAGFGLAFGKVDASQVMLDLAAAIAQAATAGKVGVVGYCWGGYLTARCAIDFGDQIAAASSYYGGNTVSLIDQTPKAPLIMHFAELDGFIPLADVDKIEAAWKNVAVYRYAGVDHGFNCDHRATGNAEAAKVARARTLEFFSKNLG